MDKKSKNEQLNIDQTTLGAKDEDKGFSITTQIMVISVLAILIIGGVLVFKQFGRSSSYKVVDLIKITETLKNDAREIALKDGVTEEQQGAILEQLKVKMNRIDQVIAAEAKKCQCTLFTRSAIVADESGIEDITDSVLLQLKKAQ
ncbi:hypothetical protein [Neisseria sp. Ec49-e6-T10]|uniref:hypothetical protein n=1 Tax=Neisseria sp. Ec49-e6-T10 TaxID=3140744 RepID=UPI003EBE04AE